MEQNNQSQHITKAISFLICLLPILLITGPFLPDLAVCLSSILFIYLLIKNREFKILYNKLYIFFFIFCAYLVIVSLNSDNIYLSLESSLFYFRFGLLSLIICWLLLNYKPFTNHFFYILLLSFLFLFFDSIYAYLFGTSIFGYEYDGVRFSSVFGEEKKLGSYISRLYPLIIFFILLKKNLPFKKVIILFIFCLSLILVTLSGERTALFIFIVFNIICLFCIKNLFKLFLFNILIGICIFTFIILTNEILYERIISTTLRGFKDVDNNIFIFTKNHQSHYLTSLMIFLDNPIFGIGPKMFREACQYADYIVYDGCSTHPHNTYMQLLSEVGILGFLPVISIFLFSLCIIIIKLFSNIFAKVNYYTDQYMILQIIIFLNLFPFIPSGSFFNNWVSIIYFIPIGFLLYTINKSKIK